MYVCICTVYTGALFCINTLRARDLNFFIKFRGVPNPFKYFVVQRIPQVIGCLDVAKATRAHFKISGRRA